MRDPDTIEREIATERDRLVQSLRALDDRLSPEAIVQRAVQGLRGPARSATQGATGLVRDNPLALALIGSGVAWLFASATHGDVEDADRGPAAAAHDPRVKQTARGLSDTSDPVGGPMAGFDARVAAADAAMRREDQATRQQDLEGDDIMSMTGTGLHDTETQFGAHPGKRARLRQTAAELRERIHEGLEDLPDAAKSRILEARLKAIEVQAAVEARIARTSESVRAGANDNPLLLGAIAFGVGAAVAAALPRTSVENRALGAQRDQLLDAADRMVREETAKLRSVAEAAVEEGKDAVKDTLRTGPPTEDDPVERVHKAAKTEAKRQGVGKVS
jgi:ElaB/YqjD/DUF883 family membrane-anchored ribosome-binding protein